MRLNLSRANRNTRDRTACRGESGAQTGHRELSETRWLGGRGRAKAREEARVAHEKQKGDKGKREEWNDIHPNDLRKCITIMNMRHTG